jgi:hypothetical protein
VGLDLDLGSMWQLPEFLPGVTTRVSLSVNNLVASSFNLVRIGSNSSPLAPQLARTITLAGHARFPGFWKADHIDFVVDLADFVRNHNDRLQGNFLTWLAQVRGVEQFAQEVNA